MSLLYRQIIIQNISLLNRNYKNYMLICLFAFLSLSGCSSNQSLPSSQNSKTTALSISFPHPQNARERLSLARQYIQSQLPFGAIEQLDVLRMMKQDTDETDVELADLYTQIGEPEAAVNVLAHTVSRSNPSINAILAYIRALSNIGDFRTAASACSSLIPQWYNLADNPRQFLVRTMLLAYRTTEAGRLIPASTNDPAWLSLKGFWLTLSDHPAEAISNLKRAAAVSPTDGWNLYLLGRAYLEAGNSDSALRVWQKADNLPDRPTQGAVGAALILIRKKEYIAADNILRSIPLVSRNSPSYWLARSMTAEGMKQHSLAQLAFGYASFHDGAPWKAETIWKSAIPTAHGIVARALYTAIYDSAFQRHDTQTTLNYVSMAAKRWPRDPTILKSQAETLLGLNQLDKAKKVACRAEKLAPPGMAAAISELMARIALDSGDVVLLKRSVQTSAQLDPNDPTPLLHLAEWQNQQSQDPQNLQETLSLYQRAYAIAPDCAEAFAHAGLLLARRNHLHQAYIDLLKALSLSPRVLNGAPNAELVQIERQQGLIPEEQFEEEQYQLQTRIKDNWPDLLKTLREQNPPLKRWISLGNLALYRHEYWVALCSFQRASELSPRDPVVWLSMAAARKQLGQFEKALQDMKRVRNLTKAKI